MRVVEPAGFEPALRGYPGTTPGADLCWMTRFPCLLKATLLPRPL